MAPTTHSSVALDNSPVLWPEQILQRTPRSTRAFRMPGSRDLPKRRVAYTIACRQCETILSSAAEVGWTLASRGTRTNLYSASLVTKHIQVSGTQTYRTTLCECDKCDVACSTCGHDVGYVVARMCHECTQARHNGNRYVIYPAAILAQVTEDSPKYFKHVPER